MLKMVLATGLNGELGKGGKLLWDCKEDLAYFKKQTEGGVVIIGSKTYDGLPFTNGLPSRENIVLTTQDCNDIESVTFIEGVESLLEYLEYYHSEQGVWVIGGASIYRQFKDLVSEIHHSCINKSYPEADTFFNMDWVEDEEVFEKVSEKQLCDIATVKVYKRR